MVLPLLSGYRFNQVVPWQKVISKSVSTPNQLSIGPSLCVRSSFAVRSLGKKGVLESKNIPDSSLLSPVGRVQSKTEE